ncbi:hypothetical protein V5799_033974 [Amblyomma americanum]|uniref:Uncharacterized protein n=1 Tax=Amblyomma americanum TaxID=6943 RepID=A0AAQ4DLT0_AMBAM
MRWVKAENGHRVRHERQAGGERDWSTCFLGPTGVKMKQALKRCPLPSQGFPCRCTQEWCHEWTAPSCPDAASILRLVDALARAIWTRPRQSEEETDLLALTRMCYIRSSHSRLQSCETLAPRLARMPGPCPLAATGQRFCPARDWTTAWSHSARQTHDELQSLWDISAANRQMLKMVTVSAAGERQATSAIGRRASWSPWREEKKHAPNACALPSKVFMADVPGCGATNRQPPTCAGAASLGSAG